MSTKIAWEDVVQIGGKALRLCAISYSGEIGYPDPEIVLCILETDSDSDGGKRTA